MSEQPEFNRASRLGSIEVSEIVRIAESAAARRAAGEDVIGLGTGEPDFDTPQHVKDAATAAMAAGATKYTANLGTPELRAAVCAKFERDNGFSPTPEEVIVSTGAKQVLYNAMLATLEPGDEVVISAPYWATYVDLVRVCGGTPVVVACGPEADYKLTPERLTDALTPRSRWVFINSPNNPTGVAYSAAELAALAAVVAGHPRAWVLTDEIYEHLSYAGASAVSLRSAAPALADRTLVVNGVSKAYCMTGWRIGFGTGPRALISAMGVAQNQITSGTCSIAQAAAVAALNGPQEGVAERAQSFRERRDLVHGRLAGLPGVDCRLPDGAYYLFPSLRGLLGRRTPDGAAINDAADFCHYLLASENLALVPGRAFGMADHLRLTFAYARDDLERACDRLERAVAALVHP